MFLFNQWCLFHKEMIKKYCEATDNKFVSPRYEQSRRTHCKHTARLCHSHRISQHLFAAAAASLGRALVACLSRILRSLFICTRLRRAAAPLFNNKHTTTWKLRVSSVAAWTRCAHCSSEKCVRDELKSAHAHRAAMERNAIGSMQFHIHGAGWGESIRLHFCNRVTLKTETQQIGMRLAMHAGWW